MFWPSNRMISRLAMRATISSTRHLRHLPRPNRPKNQGTRPRKDWVPMPPSQSGVARCCCATPRRWLCFPRCAQREKQKECHAPKQTWEMKRVRIICEQIYNSYDQQHFVHALIFVVHARLRLTQVKEVQAQMTSVIDEVRHLRHQLLDQEQAFKTRMATLEMARDRAEDEARSLRNMVEAMQVPRDNRIHMHIKTRMLTSAEEVCTLTRRDVDTRRSVPTHTRAPTPTHTYMHIHLPGANGRLEPRTAVVGREAQTARKRNRCHACTRTRHVSGP